jgi:hypothetical protein
MSKPLVLLFSAIFMMLLTTPILAIAQPQIIVDGDPSDWKAPLPSQDNTYIISDGEFVWKDATGDERTDFAGSVNPDLVDLVEWRITGDGDYLYMLFKFKNMSGISIGDNGATFIAVTIDRDLTSGSGEIWFAGESDTKVNSSAAWEYQIVVNLADSRYRNQGLRSITHPLNESTNNWGAIFQLLDKNWNHLYVPGDTGAAGLLAVNLDNNCIEFKINWSLIGGAPAGGSIRFEVITAVGWSNYGGNGGGTWDISGSSDALDAVTTIGPNTWSEVEDGVVDYYVEVSFATPVPYPVPEPWIVGLVALVIAGLYLVFRRMT